MIVPTAQSVTTIAAAHAQGSSVRLLFATITAGSDGQRMLTGLRAQTFSAENPRAVAEALESGGGGGVQVLIRVLSSAQTIAKSAALPDAEDGQPSSPEAITDALRLLAESDLPGNLPAHRRAAGSLHVGGTRFPDRKPAGLLTGWPTLAALTPPTHRTALPCPEVCIAEVAALAALAQAIGGCEQAAYIDRTPARASGAVVIAGPEKTLARVFRLPAESGAAQTAAAARTIAETAKAAGIVHPIAAPDAPQALVLEPSSSSPPVPPELRDATWRTQHGLCYGALVAFISPDPNVASLVNLHEREPKARPPLWERSIRWFGHPLRAAAAIVLCAAIMLGLPLSAAYARFAELKKTTGGDATITTRTADAEREVAFYRLLREKRWPMTKVLADLAGAAPVGIMLESLDLNASEGGVGGGGVIIRGTAANSDLVTAFRENLTKTFIFSQVKTPSITANSTGSGGGAKDDPDAKVAFTLNATIAPGAAMLVAKPADDFAAKTLADRLYGTSGGGGGNGKTLRRPESASSRAPSGSRESNSGSRPDRRSTRAPESSSTGASSPRASSSVSVPPPLSAEKIAKLDRTQAMLEWTSRKKAAAQAGVDEATRKRLTDESDKAKARFDELRNAEKGGAS